MADCIEAKKKFAWINAIYKLDGKYREYVSDIYTKYKNIVCVSESAFDMFCEVFPECKEKGRIIYDINNEKTVKEMSMLPSNAKIEMSKGRWKLLTVGRLAQQKGYDIALQACKLLKEQGIEFTWYVLGRGPLEQAIKEKINEFGIQDCFALLGAHANPYPYFSNADIYVQTSRFEGFGIAIAEARMLNIPVVTTRFDAVFAQMVDGQNGLVVNVTAEAVADGIQKLMKDKSLYNHIVEYQSQEKKGNTEEILKIYDLIER